MHCIWCACWLDSWARGADTKGSLSWCCCTTNQCYAWQLLQAMGPWLHPPPTPPSLPPRPSALPTPLPWPPCRDDREDVSLAGEVPLQPGPGGPSAGEAAQQQLYAKQQREMEEQQRELERRRQQEQRRMERDVAQLSLRQGGEALARVSGGSGGSGGGRAASGPALEVTVMRVVGCELLTNGITGRDFAVVTYAGSRPGGARRQLAPPSMATPLSHASGLPRAATGLRRLCHAPHSLPAPLVRLPFPSQPPTAAPTPRLAATATRTTRRWCACPATRGSSRRSPRSCVWMGGGWRWARCKWRSCTRWALGGGGGVWGPGAHGSGSHRSWPQRRRPR
jgi:hypothetical protein